MGVVLYDHSQREPFEQLAYGGELLYQRELQVTIVPAVDSYWCDASNSSSNSAACARLARLCQVASQVGYPFHFTRN